MKITTSPIRSMAEEQQAVNEAKVAIESSKWHKMASGEYGQSRVNEGKMMLSREEQRIRQLQDIANHAPAEPMVQVEAYDSYAQKDTLKANGFRWDGIDKCWSRSVKAADLDALLTKIGAK